MKIFQWIDDLPPEIIQQFSDFPKDFIVAILFGLSYGLLLKFFQSFFSS